MPHLAWLDYLAFCLAIGTPINAWIFEGGIFDTPRERIRVWGTANNLRQTWNDCLRYTLADGLTCAYCLHHHVAFWLSVCLLLPIMFGSPLVSQLCKWPLYVLAGIRLSWLIHLQLESRFFDAAGPSIQFNKSELNSPEPDESD